MSARGALLDYTLVDGEVQLVVDYTNPTVMLRARHQLDTDLSIAFWCFLNGGIYKFDAGIVDPHNVNPDLQVRSFKPEVIASMPAVGGQNFVMALKLVGNQVELRAWGASGTRPAQAQYTYSLPDADNLPGGLVGLGVVTHEARVFDLVIF